ncbi:SDR family oxidoreductase [Streptomyces sp. NBC_00006]|uniref:SDR family oxidoreductase n=1 Tax=Streptomyces sp. NBC_00006 TaxID=2975619 RepID=UPI00224F1E53|nr:SDR family oxidoreductase [Streptomyces sp. NBC_00006]MCX5529629.1 SDR family oxidoreductase [Streptomyces sp. NBC_00006]
MRIFVAGATGYVGSAIVSELLQAGHEVVGLARSDASAATLARAGIAVHRGDLGDLDSLRAGAAKADGVVFAANQHISETTDSAARARVELNAVEAIGSELEQTGKPFVVTSGVIGRTPGQVLIEETPAVPNAVTGLRLPVETYVLALGGRGVRSSSVRLAPTVHGRGDARGFVSMLIGIARAKGVSAFVGEGANRWSSVHRRDAAVLFRLAVESAPPGTPVHAVAEEGVRFRDIAESIGRQLKLPAVSLTAEEASGHFGLLAPLVSLDNPTSSALTRERFGWVPAHPGLIADIEDGHYFKDTA